MSIQTRDLVPEVAPLRPSHNSQGQQSVKTSPEALPEQLAFAFEAWESASMTPRKPPAREFSTGIGRETDSTGSRGSSCTNALTLPDSWYRVVDPDFNPWNSSDLNLLCSTLGAYKIGSGWKRIAGLVESSDFARVDADFSDDEEEIQT